VHTAKTGKLPKVPDRDADDSTHTYVPPTTGTMVSHYHIVSKIGAGGMGEVNLADDTRLNRIEYVGTNGKANERASMSINGLVNWRGDRAAKSVSGDHVFRLLTMRIPAIILLLLLASIIRAQAADTLTIKYSESKYDSTFFKRTVQHDAQSQIYHVTDTYLSGQIASQGDYLVIDPAVKEEFWNYHQTHIKHGYFRKWYDNGQLEWEGRFENGFMQGPVSEWYRNGQLHYVGEYRNGMQEGPFTYYDEQGKVRYEANFIDGSTVQPAKVRYEYLTYLPHNYDRVPDTNWPVIIYLHGGSSRGNDLKRVKATGIPDRLERGKNIPFIVIAPQCPVDKRWETDDWFDILYAEIISRYRIDTNRIYLTGFSLGGSGTWYLAMKHPSTFAAIAPISARVLNLQYISDNVSRLAGMPIWIFHGKDDEIVDVSEACQIARLLDQCDIKYSLSVFEGYRHWQPAWEVYGGDEIYSWFLQFKRQQAE
jgi:hypothetical protein